jgi:hypothetical protein
MAIIGNQELVGLHSVIMLFIHQIVKRQADMSSVVVQFNGHCVLRVGSC